CSSPLPGLRSRDMCCRGLGKGWGFTDCVLCPQTGTQGSVYLLNCSSPLPGLRSRDMCCRGLGKGWGFTDCVLCPQTAHSVISEEKGQCYRVLEAGQGPSSCSMPIPRNITRQICCCSRVGKAWGAHCQRCPYFGSGGYSGSPLFSTFRTDARGLTPVSSPVAFKEICPAGPGYHYTASTLQFSQRVPEQPDSKGTPTYEGQKVLGPGPGSSEGGPPRTSGTTSAGPAGTRPGPPQSRTPTHQNRPDVDECARSPGVCSVGECVNTPGSYRCVCPPGFTSNSQQNGCHDVDECQQEPCSDGRCDNTPGSFRCVCRHGYKLVGNTCTGVSLVYLTDVDECVDPLRCPGQECLNTAGSFRCASCRPGYGLLHGLCTGGSARGQPELTSGGPTCAEAVQQPVTRATGRAAEGSGRVQALLTGTAQRVHTLVHICQIYQRYT
ncbi:unnamed protein product, partial [Menidia menidia]